MLFSFSSIYSQEVDCSNFKKGKYFYTPPNGGEVWIKRKRKKQIEKYNDERQRFIFKISWEDDCKYTLVLHRTKGVNRKIKKEIIGTTLECTVIKVELDHYLVTILSKNDSSIQTITIYQK
jgi:hypothetical protein